MAHSKEAENAGRQRSAARKQRQRREKRDRQEGEAWTRRDYLRDLSRVTAPLTDEINSNPRDAARIQKSRDQVQEGEVHWGVEDEDESGKSDAGA